MPLRNVWASPAARDATKEERAAHAQCTTREEAVRLLQVMARSWGVEPEAASEEGEGHGGYSHPRPSPAALVSRLLYSNQQLAWARKRPLDAPKTQSRHALRSARRPLRAGRLGCPQ